MSGLKMKFGGDSTGQKHNADFSHLENNPNYKPEGEPSGQPVGEPAPSTGDAPAGEPSKTGDEPAVDPTKTINTGDDPNNKPEGQPSGQSSLNNDDPEPTGQKTVEITDELFYKTLSERLGKEVTSLDDLAPEPVEIDPQVKALNEWKEKTGRPIEDFFKYQKDFSQVSDLEIAREFLQIQYPTLNKDEINLELEKFIVSDDDLDTDAARKNLDLKKYAIEGRKTLDTLKTELGEPSSSVLTPEIKQQLEFTKQIQEQIKSNQGQQEAYTKGISEAALLTESMKLNLSDELSIDFKVSEQDRQDLPSFINEMPHWRDEDGSWNHKAVVQDSIKIKYFDAIVKLAYEQGVSSGTEDVVKKTKNSTLGGDPSGNPQPAGQKKPVIEGIDKMLGKYGGLKLKFDN